ncbi:MAG: aspartate--tRNA ligase [Candidatus Atribacteria bacterium]|nr:aspartate--tRNA ligase [Candidatus Atribacteria bacterium]
MLRTHNCGILRKEDIGKEVLLTGWVNRRRDHGGVIFIDLRDRWGLTQLVIDSNQQEVYQCANNVKSEFVLQAKGLVRARPEGLANPKIPTGEIEVAVSELTILSESKPLPFEIEEKNETDESLRLRYRYLDLRRTRMQKNLILRHQICQVVRRYLSERQFIEVETPFLTKSTPEGARDFLVPSRLNEGNFYALPQSPQLFKQILMIAGYDRYFQIAKCFRDEDLRADRQPEFSQVDIEMSFVEREDILELIETMMKKLFYEVLEINLETPFPRMSYDEAMNRYGCDKPDLRISCAIDDLSQLLQDAIEVGSKNDSWKGLFFQEWKSFSRKKADLLSQMAKNAGVSLSYIKQGKQEATSPLKNKISEVAWRKLLEKYSFQEDSLLLVAWGESQKVLPFLGNLRVNLGEELNLIQNQFKFCWVLDFPLFEWNVEENRWDSMHHPFTAPCLDQLNHLDIDPSQVKAQAYDIVLNGFEIGGGSIRIHRSDLQEKIFQLLNLSEAEIQQKFGYFIEALQYGCPPHGGIALGLDRIVMLMCGESSIRETMAFPKTQKGTCLMSGAPSPVSDDQLMVLGIQLRKKKESQIVKDR